MAYRNTIISLVSMVALGTACSKAPNYQNNVQKATAENAVVGDADVVSDVGHGEPAPAGTVASTETKAPDAPAATPPAANPPAAGTNNNPPAAKTEADLAKEIAAKGFVAYAVSAPNGQGWNTAQTPYLIGQTVTAAGAIDTAKPVTVYMCDFAGAGVKMTLHSGVDNAKGAGPFIHGKEITGAALDAGETLAARQVKLNAMTIDQVKALTNCGVNNVTALDTKAGATYNHQGGNAGNAASYVYFKMFTVDPAGVVAAK